VPSKVNSIVEFQPSTAGALELQLWPEAFAPDLLEHVVFSAVVVKCDVHSGMLLRAAW
jgi:hypothetical protein